MCPRQTCLHKTRIARVTTCARTQFQIEDTQQHPCAPAPGKAPSTLVNAIFNKFTFCCHSFCSPMSPNDETEYMPCCLVGAGFQRKLVRPGFANCTALSASLQCLHTFIHDWPTCTLPGGKSLAATGTLQSHVLDLRTLSFKAHLPSSQMPPSDCRRPCRAGDGGAPEASCSPAPSLRL